MVEIVSLLSNEVGVEIVDFQLKIFMHIDWVLDLDVGKTNIFQNMMILRNLYIVLFR